MRGLISPLADTRDLVMVIGGYPYFRARPDRQTRRIHFERNTSDSRGGSAVGDYAIAEVNAELVRAMVMDLVRKLYGSF